MKTLLVLFCAIYAISYVSAISSPAWTQCGTSSDVWTPTSVTAQKDPNNLVKTLVSACGTVNSPIGFTIFNNLKVSQSKSSIDIIENLPYRRLVQSGSAFCLNYTGDYSAYAPSNVLLKMTAYNISGSEAGCVSLTLTVPVS